MVFLLLFDEEKMAANGAAMFRPPPNWIAGRFGLGRSDWSCRRRRPALYLGA